MLECLIIMRVTCLPLLHLYHPDSPGVLVTCSVLTFPEAVTHDERANAEMSDFILSTTQEPPSLIPWSQTRFYRAVNAGRLISTQIVVQGCFSVGWSGVSIMR